MLRQKNRLLTVGTYLGAIVTSFVGGLVLEASKPILAPWLPWAPGGLTVLVQHQTPQRPLVAAGEMSRLVLKRADVIISDVEAPQTATPTFCQLRPGAYTVMVWVNDMLAVSDCRVDIRPGATTSVACLTNPQAELRVEVRDKRTGKAVTGVRVRIRSYKQKPWREEDVDLSGSSPSFFLEPTTLDSESYVVEILRAGKAVFSKSGIRLDGGQLTVEVEI